MIEDYYDGIDLKSKREFDSSRKICSSRKMNSADFFSGLGRFYSFEDESKTHTEDSDRYYAELLNTYGDADEWRRKQQQQTEVNRSGFSMKRTIRRVFLL